MLYTHFTREILGLQDVIIIKVESNEKELIIYAELERKQSKPPVKPVICSAPSRGYYYLDPCKGL